jgi:hypothetical protein
VRCAIDFPQKGNDYHTKNTLPELGGSTPLTTNPIINREPETASSSDPNNPSSHEDYSLSSLPPRFHYKKVKLSL